MQQGQTGQLKILLYEDTAAAAILVRTAIEESGLICEVTTASSHDEAENLLTAGQFDLLHTNFGTDDEEASRFIRSVRANHPRLLIVVLSNTRDSGKAYEAGAHAFLRKSSEWDDLARKVRGMLNFWLETAELPGADYPRLPI
jgi:DNA-binding NarL/FixJ family response regulator